MLNNLDLMHIEKNDQIIFDDVVRISGEFIVDFQRSVIAWRLNLIGSLSC